MKTCYLCGKSEAEVKITSDHVPPRSFFKKPQKNLIEVDCCQNCNWGHSNTDRRIRNLLNMMVGSGIDKDWVFQHKTSKDLKKGDNRLLHRIASEKILQEVEIKGVYYSVPAIDMNDEDEEMFRNFMIRVVKGLLKTFCPTYDYSSDVFTVDMVKVGEVSNVVKRCTETLKAKPIGDKRGNDAFHSLRFIDSKQRCGVWFLVFFQGPTFQIFHEKLSKS